MSLDPRLRKLLRIGLIGGGAATVMSSAVSIYATYQLIEPADAESLGITRGEFVRTYVVLLVIGAAMAVVGWRLKNPGPK